MKEAELIKQATKQQNFDIMVSSETNEWYTPAWIIERARSHMGSIDCDPATSKTAQRWIQARTYYTIEENGLNGQWFGNVWLNPPYGKTKGRSNAEIWAEKLEEEFICNRTQQAYLLLSTKHGYKWYNRLWKLYPCVMLDDRVRFIDQYGAIAGQSKVSTTLLYFGHQWDAFKAMWQDVGRVLFP